MTARRPAERHDHTRRSLDGHACAGQSPRPDAIGTPRWDLVQALQRLPVSFRTAVVLIDVEGLSYAEAAEALGWPIGTVRSRVHRGRRALRTALRPGDDAA